MMKIHFDEIFAVTAPGLENTCAGEIRNLFGSDCAVGKGGVTFSGGLEELYLANLWLRTASRILVRVGHVKATDFPELHRKVRKLPWGRFVKTDRPVLVKAVSRRSRLNHTDRVAETVTDAIDKSLGRSPQQESQFPQVVQARFEDDCCLLSVDSSGELLHRRGYRTEVSRAPLRETLAAGILQLLAWDGRKPLVDPMCGSGTFLIEGALIAANRPPGMARVFSFQHWPRYRHGLWKNLVDLAERKINHVTVPLQGFDRDPAVIQAARNNAERAGHSNAVQFENLEIDEVAPATEAGLLVCNPPYGIRLGDERELQPLFARMGQAFRQRFPGWQIALFCPSEKLVEATGLEFRTVSNLVNGGVETSLFVWNP